MERKSDPLQKETFFDYLFENSRIGKVILYEQGRLVCVNRRMYEFLSFNLDDTTGMLFGEAFRCSHFGASCSECGKSENDRCDLIHAIQIIRKDGIIDNNIMRFSSGRNNREETKWFQLNGAAVSYRDQKYILLIFADIADLKQRESHKRTFIAGYGYRNGE